MDGSYIEVHNKLCQRFSKYFHKGVVFRHKGSKIRWTVKNIIIEKSSGARLALCSSRKGRRKIITADRYEDYDIVKTPLGIEVLFGE